MMLDFLPAPVKGVLSFLLYLVNTVALCTPLFVVAFLKFVIRFRWFRNMCDRVLIGIALAWISVNRFNSRLFSRIEWDIRGVSNLKMADWYLVLSNHQSWVDILVLQSVFQHRIPFLKFFIKKELIWVPILGLAWWAMDFPFMRRYSRKFLEKNPHLRGKDLEVTRRACEKFRHLPISVTNFVEGTRFTPAKHQHQASPYRHLLKPRAGGVAFVLGAMGDQMKQIVNVTIVYPDGADNFWGFISGRIRRIIVDVEVIPITDDLKGDYFEDAEFKERFCGWLNRLWGEKDVRIGRILNSEAGPV